MTAGNRSAPPRIFWPALGRLVLSPVLRRTGENLLRWVLVLGRAPGVQLPRVRAGALIVVAVIVSAIVASMFLLDAAASDWARHLPQWIAGPADEVTNFGRSDRLLYPLAFILFILAAVTRPSLPLMARGVLAALAARFGFLFVAIAAPSLFDTIVKRLIGRARPYVGTHDNPFAYKPLIWRPEYASMPSGHVTTAAAAAIAIGAIWPRMRFVMWLYALIIMSSRVVINVHHPSDVLAGAVVGVVGALMVRRWFASRRLVFFANDLGVSPAPSWHRLKAVAWEVVGRQSAAAH